MALSTEVTPTVFEDNDEDTWRLLASQRSPEEDSDLKRRLQSLAKRFVEDNSLDEHWATLVSKLQSNGFHYSIEAIKPLNQATSSASGSATTTPVAFESELGKKHVAATAMLLGVNDRRAVQITLSALRTVDTDGSHFQTLLASRDLLLKTLLHHHQQRLARLGVLTECLRLEQDTDAAQRAMIVEVLDSLDSTYADDDCHRGLFRRLVGIACAPTLTPTREQLEPTKALHDHFLLASSLQQSSVNVSDQGWNSFSATILEQVRTQQMRERTEAMEALLVLLYERINGGVRRSDFALLLIAMKSTFDFFTDCPKPREPEGRLSKLAALVCTECMALWRVSSNDGEVWATRHPLLLGLFSVGKAQPAEYEIDSLRRLILDYAEAGHVRQESMSSRTDKPECPEALAILPFGLLLYLAHDSIQGSDGAGSPDVFWMSFRSAGTEMVQIANDKYDSFDYLRGVVDGLTSKGLHRRSSAAHDQLYDWQFSSTQQMHGLLLEQDTSSLKLSTAPENTAYTSIAREVLAASIAAFESTILAIHQDDSCANIGMLCNLTSTIYQNNPLLCQQFWTDWGSFIATPDNSASVNSASVRFPICRLLDASHKMTVAAFDAHNQGRIPDELFVAGTAPFFQLLSRLSHNHEVVETTVSFLPDGLVRNSLLCCRLASENNGGELYQRSQITLLNALGELARVGNSTSCLLKLRSTLEEPTGGSEPAVDGPRVLARLLSESSQPEIHQPVLSLIAHLLDGAPQDWVLRLAHEFIASHESQVGLARFLSPGKRTSHAAALVLAELIEHMSAVVFSDSLTDHDAIAFLHFLATGLLAAGTTLSSSMSTATTGPDADASFSFETAQTILQSFTNLLKLIRTVIELHRSPQVREAGLEVRDTVINGLATSAGIGQAIAYYAVAPVSLSLTIKVEAAMEDQSILQQVSTQEDYDESKAEKYGAWQAVLFQQHGTRADHLAKHFLLDNISKFSIGDLDLEGIQSRGWSSAVELETPLHAAWSAIRLLSVWASHVEDIASTHIEDKTKQAAQLSDQAKVLIETLSPQRLLCSLSPSPPPCRVNGNMVAIWDSAGLSTFELLLPYLTEQNGLAEFSHAYPSFPVLDLISACLGHVQSACPEDLVADSMLYRAVYRSPRLSEVLTDSVIRTLSITESSQQLNQSEKDQVLNGILSLRVLSSCVAANATVAEALLRISHHSIVPDLVKTASVVPGLLSKPGMLLEAESDVVQLRVASGAVEVLAALWRTARSVPGPAGSKLVAAVNEQEAFITTLVTFTATYANSADLESRIEPSNISESARCTLTNFVSLSLDILATEALHSVRNEKSMSSALESFLLKDAINVQRFVGNDGYRHACEISTSFADMGVAQHVSPVLLLRCFPSTSNSRLTTDFYSSENTFDVSSAVRWLSERGLLTGDTSGDLLVKLSISCQMAQCNLRILTSWRRFAETSAFLISTAKADPTTADRMYGFAKGTLTALETVVSDIKKYQVEVPDNSLQTESMRMTVALSEMQLFFLDMGTSQVGTTDHLPLETVSEILATLARTSDSTLSIASPAFVPSISSMKAHEPFLVVGCPLLASAIIAVGLVQSHKGWTDSGLQNTIVASFEKLCRATGRVLQTTSMLIRDSGCEESKKQLREALLCCISLFTALIAKTHGARLDDAAYFKGLSGVLSEYSVTNELVWHALSASDSAAESLKKSGFQVNKLSGGEQQDLLVISAVLDMLFSVTEANSPDMLATLPGPSLSQLLVRNPLFHTMRRGQAKASHPRGYILSRTALDASHTKNSFDPANFQIGEPDPIHDIWITSMKVIGASLRASSAWMVVRGSGELGMRFVDLSVEFLRCYASQLTAILKSCGSKFTRKSLEEVVTVLALVSELCKRNTRDKFFHSCKELCDEFIAWSKFIVVSVSKFLAAAGTARELFLCIQEYETAESATYENTPGGQFRPRHPLLAEGLPSAKHEAVKLSHFASRCYERVTKADFAASAATPNSMESLAKDRDSDSDLERSCRHAVTNEFANKIEAVAAGCLSQALSILWRTHPTSFSFHTFSQNEIAKIDIMAKVTNGMVIGYRPLSGESTLADAETNPLSFDKLRFGRVTARDTVKRVWYVAPLEGGATHGPGEGDRPLRVHAEQLAGVEEPSARKAITSFLPAPNSMSDLEKSNTTIAVGHLVLILRWCHQQSLTMEGGALDRGFRPSSLVRRLAEQTVALLGAEMSIHEEIGSRKTMSVKESSRLDAQIYELFADQDVLGQDSTIAAGSSTSRSEGRLKEVIDKGTWEAVRPQIVREMQRSCQEKQEKERRKREKRALSGDNTTWFSGVRRKGSSHKSAFRGLG